MSALISLMCPCRIKVFINKYKNNTETLWQVQIVHLPKPARFYNSAHLWIKRLNGGDLHVVSDICWKEAHPKISQFLLSLTRIHSIWEMIIFIRRLPSERVLPCHKISQITLCCSCWDAVMTAGEMNDFWHSHSQTYCCKHLLLAASRGISVTPSAVSSRSTDPWLLLGFACGEQAFNNELWVCMLVCFELWELLCLRGWFLWKRMDL